MLAALCLHSLTSPRQLHLGNGSQERSAPRMIYFVAFQMNIHAPSPGIAALSKSAKFVKGELESSLKLVYKYNRSIYCVFLHG